MDDNNGKGWIVAYKYFVTTEEDTWERGVLPGACGTSWDWKLKNRFYSSKKSLLDEIRESDWLFNELKDDDFEFYDGALRWSAMADVDNTPPSDAQYERFKKGEERLWIADGWLPLSWVPVKPDEMTDDKAESYGFSIG